MWQLRRLKPWVDFADPIDDIMQKSSTCCYLQVSLQDIRQAQRAEKEQEKIKKSMKARMDFLDFE